MAQLLTKAAFAERAGVTKQSIGVQCSPGGALVDAVVDGKIDASHAAAKAYLKRQKAKAEADGAPTISVKSPADLSGIPDDGSPDFILAVMAIPLLELEDKFGGRAEFEGWLKTLKLAEEIREKRLKNDETDGSLIPRELVKVHILGLIESVFQRMLTDAVKTVVRTVYANATSGIASEQTESEVRGILSKLLEPLKRKASKALREG